MMPILTVVTLLDQGLHFVRVYTMVISRQSAQNCGARKPMEVVCVAVLFLGMAFIVEIKSGACLVNVSSMSVRLLEMRRVYMGIAKV